MRRVLKFVLGPGTQYVSLGNNPKILLFAVQGNQTYIWVETDGYLNSPQTILRIYATGEEIPENARHIGSCKSDDYGTYIWHLYQIIR